VVTSAANISSFQFEPGPYKSQKYVIVTIIVLIIFADPIVTSHEMCCIFITKAYHVIEQEDIISVKSKNLN
jgi:hypothetical protein